MRVEIKKVVSGGFGLAFAEGKTVFVKNALLGETAEIKILKRKSKIIYAQARRILNPSPLRIEPDCRHYPSCGGCSFLHTDYETEIKLKHFIMKENIARFLKKDLTIDDFCASKERFGCRNTAEFHLKAGKIGYYDEEKNVFDVEECPILNPAIIYRLKEIKQYLQKKKIRRVKIKTNGSDISDVFGQKTLLFDNGGLKFFNSHKSFIQQNFYIVPRIAEEIKNELCGNFDGLIDAYGGCGIYSFYLSGSFKRVLIVEESKDSYNDFIKTNAFNGFSNIEFKSARFEDAKLDFIPQVLIINPPRSGLTEGARKKTIETLAEKIFYISCSDTVMLRDLNFLSEYYNIRRVKGFDMFPGTKHFEVLAVLTKKERE